MALFGAIDTSHSGLRVMRTWMDAVSDNIANVNTVRSTDEEAFQARYVLARSVEDGLGRGRGAAVVGAQFSDPEGRMVHWPDHPLADAEGYVRLPDVDLGQQMTDMIVAQRGYQANLSVIDRARDAYLQALSIGK